MGNDWFNDCQNSVTIDISDSDGRKYCSQACLQLARMENDFCINIDCNNKLNPDLWTIKRESGYCSLYYKIDHGIATGNGIFCSNKCAGKCIRCGLESPLEGFDWCAKCQCKTDGCTQQAMAKYEWCEDCMKKVQQTCELRTCNDENQPCLGLDFSEHDGHKEEGMRYCRYCLCSQPGCYESKYWHTGKPRAFCRTHWKSNNGACTTCKMHKSTREILKNYAEKMG